MLPQQLFNMIIELAPRHHANIITIFFLLAIQCKYQYKENECIPIQKVLMKQSAPKTLDKAFEQITSEMLETFLKKHKDYGKGNILSIKELGIAFRIGEKVERLKHLLMKEDAPANESLDDTWRDIAVYAIIAELYRKGWFEKLDVEPEKLK